MLKIFIMQPLQLIKLNSTGPAVIKWQSFLIKQGFNIGNPDGAFGINTYNATKTFQQQQGLPSDGVVGSNTYAAAMVLGFNAVLSIADFMGIDVSHINGVIDWPAVKADPQNIEFVYIKATEGTTVQDTKYGINIQQSTAAGLSTGAYHFYSLTSSPENQAANFIKIVGANYPYKLPPVLDYEKDVNGSDIDSVIAGLNTWLTIVENKWGIQPIIYTSKNYWDQLNNPSGFAKYNLWLANYNPGLPSLPGDWIEWAIWQYSCKGSVQGIPGAVDFNKYNSGAGLI
jgi:lysozyme